MEMQPCVICGELTSNGRAWPLCLKHSRYIYRGTCIICGEWIYSKDNPAPTYHRACLGKNKGGIKKPVAGVPNNSTKFDCRGDTAETEFISDEPCRTVEDVIRKGDIDVSIWDIERFILNSWEMGYKKDFVAVINGKEVIMTKASSKPLWQVKVWLKKKSIRTEEIIQAVTDRMKAYAPVVPNFHSNRPKTGYMWELDIMDLHVGKFAWKLETGNNWDTKLAIKANNQAVNDLLDMATVKGYVIEQILMPVGNDLLHVDNLLGETTKGTRQDCDSRVLKMFTSTLDMLVAQIDRLKTIAPVYIPIMSGNHDLLSTMYMGVTLWSWYHNDPNVTINIDPISRKYYQFGKCLIGFCHGCQDDPKPEQLPFLMSTESGQAWVDCIHKTIHIGHNHKSKQIKFIAQDSWNGVDVRTIRSLTGTDLWHHNHGYTSPNSRGAEAFLWHKELGQIQHNTALAIDA